MITAILILVVFLCFVALMYLKRITAMLALPLMAILFAIISNAPKEFILKNVLQQGPIEMSLPILATIFGGILAMFIKNQGIAELLIRYTAELAGDRPLVLAVTLLFVTAVLFTSLGGLGAVIMVGTFVLPILMSIGIPPVTAGVIMIIGLSMGGMVNISNWQLYITFLGIEKNTVRDFMIVLVGLYAATGLVFCAWALRPSQLHRFYSTPKQVAPTAKRQFRRLALFSPIVPLLFVLALDWPIVPSFLAGIVYAMLASTSEGETAIISFFVLMVNILLIKFFLPDFYQQHTTEEMSFLSTVRHGILLLLPFIGWIAYILWRLKRKHANRTFFLSAPSPVATLFLIHIFQIGIEISFIAGGLIAIAITARPKTIQSLTKSVLEGFGTIAPAVVLIIGIGMLLASVKHENISQSLTPFLTFILPSTPVTFVIIFSALAPLALYRGPLNILGMGSGFAALMLTAGVMKPEAIMAVLASVGAIQSVCDPTNVHNVWVASNNKVEAVEITKRTLPFIWPMVVVALIIAAIRFYS